MVGETCDTDLGRDSCTLSLAEVRDSYHYQLYRLAFMVCIHLQAGEYDAVAVIRMVISSLR